MPISLTAFTSAVDVAINGAIGLTYYDFRNNRTYALTGITKYGVLVSGIQTGFSMILAIAIYPMLITSLKRPYFVTAYNGDFVQCVSPIIHQPQHTSY
jgi:hypothetical protein